MACADDTTILAYFRGELGGDEVAAIERELDQCASCRELMLVVASAWRQNDGELGELRRQGTKVGRYVIDRVLGAGAMGVVYAATDPDLAREVALKLMSRPSPALAERFRREAQAMARLSHRNVVSVFDVGGTGVEAFVAMEQIRGRTLREWLSEPRALPAILEVFAQAADGLAAAHDAGIVHRDFKPENVLVGDDGVVRVSDFGLAQLGTPVEPAAGPPAETTALATARAGTPAYLAPEVEAGSSGSPRADQYSFWIALHEAVTGERPREGSRVSRPRRLARAMERGLVADPAARFGSLHDVAAELRAIRGGGRRRRAIAAAVVAVLAIGAGGWWLARDRTEPCASAGGELAEVWPGRASAVRDSLARDPRPYAANVAAVASARLDAYAEQWRAGAVGACRATHVDHTQSAELLDRRIGCLAQRRAELTAVVEQLARPGVVEHAIELVGGLSAIEVCADVTTLSKEPVPPRDPAAIAAIAAVRTEIARAKTYFLSGTFRDGLAIAAHAVEQARRIGHRPLLAEALETYGGLMSSARTPADALPVIEEALREAEASQDVYAALAIRLRESKILGTLGKSDEALRVARLGLATAEAANVPGTEADFEVEIGVLESDLGHNDVALAAYEKALANFERAHGKDSDRVGHVLGLIGLVLDDLGRHDEALLDLQRALEIDGKVAGKHHPDYANDLSNLASHFYARNDVAKAFELSSEAHTIRLAALAPDHPEVAMSWSNLGAILISLHRLPEAREDLEKALAIKLRVLGPDNPSVGFTEVTLSQLSSDLHDAPAALDYAQRGVANFRKSLGEDHPNTAHAEVQLGVALASVKRWGESAAVIDAVLPRLAGDPSLPRFQFDLAESLLQVHGDARRIADLVAKARAGAKAGNDRLLLDALAREFGP